MAASSKARRALPSRWPVASEVKVALPSNSRISGCSLVRVFHGEASVADAEETFEAVARREVPDDAPEVEVGGDEEVWIVDLITRAGFAKTNGEARRFVRGGAVRLGGEVVEDEKATLCAADLDGAVLQVGKRRYARLVVR